MDWGFVTIKFQGANVRHLQVFAFSIIILLVSCVQSDFDWNAFRHSFIPCVLNNNCRDIAVGILPDQSNLKIYWTMNEATSFSASYSFDNEAASSHDAILSNSQIFTENDYLAGGGAAFFDGSTASAHYFSTSSTGSEAIDTGSDITISLWIKPTDLANEQVLLSTSYSSKGWEFGIYNTATGNLNPIDLSPENAVGTSTGARLEFILNSTSAGTQTVVCSYVNVLNYNTWQHVAVTYESGTPISPGSKPNAKIFHNGVEVSDPGCASVPTTTTSLFASGYPIHAAIKPYNYTSNRYSGYMDNIAIWSSVLNKQQILQIFNDHTSQ